MGKKKEIIIESVDPKKLTKNELIQISWVEKDMWAYWIWEYVKCKNCWEIHSKNDIYWHLENEIKIESVTKIEELLGLDSIECNNCQSNNTEFIYDIDTNLEEINKRLFESDTSYISLCKNKTNDIIWVMDWYTTNFTNIYQREFDYRYKNIWEKNMKDFIELQLWKKLENILLTFSTFWTYEKYRSLNILFKLFKNFIDNINNEDINKKLIVELDYNSTIHWLYHALWISEIWFLWNKNLINRWKKYNSDIFIHNNIYSIKENIPESARKFIVKFWRKMNEVLLD